MTTFTRTQQEAERQAYERAQEEWERKKEQGLLAPYELRPDLRRMPLTHPMDTNPMYAPEGFHYEGPIPDAVLEVRLTNKGRVAAQDISGSVELKAGELEPMYFPGLHADEPSGPDSNGFLKAELVTIRELLHNEEDRYLIGVRIPTGGSTRSGGRAKVRYAFITPAGLGATKETTVELSR